MMTLSITSTVTAILALLMFPLTLQISLRRAALGKAEGDFFAFVFGDGNDAVLRRRIRAFGNFIEYTPFCILLLAFIEIASAPNAVLYTTASLLLGGRVIHAAGMLLDISPLRGLAMFMTYITLLLPSIWLLLNINAGG